MTKRKKTSRIALSSFLIGLLTGISWLGGQLPVSLTGLFVYDSSRYAFCVCVLVVMGSLASHKVRERGLRWFCVGLLISTLTFVYCLPPANRPIIQMTFLFGFPLGLVLAIALTILWLAGRPSSGRMQIENTSSVPKRFGMGTIFATVMAACLLLSLANAVGFPAGLTIGIGIFLSIIFASQMWMERVPRVASVTAGAILFPATVAACWNYWGLNGHPFLSRLVNNPADIIYLAAHLLTIGGILGYLGGVLVASIFLAIDYHVAFRAAKAENKTNATKGTA